MEGAPCSDNMAAGRKLRLWVGVPVALLLLAGALAGVVALSFRPASRRTLVFSGGSRLIRPTGSIKQYLCLVHSR